MSTSQRSSYHVGARATARLRLDELGSAPVRPWVVAAIRAERVHVEVIHGHFPRTAARRPATLPVHRLGPRRWSVDIDAISELAQLGLVRIT
jgi:hypothetical protein